MKKIILLTLFLFLGITTSFKAQTWDWMKPVGFNYSEFSTTELTKSPTGNLLIRCASSYGMPVKTDLILCSPVGEILWRKSFPSVTIEDVCMDALDNVYFSGSFTGAITLGSATVISTGSSDALIVKLNNNGDYQDHLSFGTTTAESAYSLAYANNALFLTGFFRNSFSVGGFPFTAAGDKRAFLLKLNSDLAAVKAFQTDSMGTASGIKVNVNEAGEVFLLSCGDHLVGVGNTTLSIADAGQFLAKFSNDLEPDWAKVIINHYMEGYYYPYVLFDKQNNLVLIRKTGGGGGASHHLDLSRRDLSGNILSNKIVPENFNGYVDLDTSGTVWVAGRDVPFAPPAYFSISKTSLDNTVDTLFYDDEIAGDVINGFALNFENDFYILAKCQNGNSFGANTCASEGEAFLVHYGNGLNTGVSAVVSAEELNIYPNPSTGVFTLELNDQLRQATSTICVYDLLGRCISTQTNTNESKQQIDLSGAGKGIYFIELEIGEARLNKRIVLN